MYKKTLLFFFILILFAQSIYSGANEDLIAAINAGKLQKVKDAISAGANPDAKDESGLPVFLLSISKKNKQIIQYFLSLEIDFTVKDKNENSALHYLANTSDTATIEVLLSKGLSTNEINSEGQTPLHIAIQKKQPKTASILIKNKPDLNKKDSNGNTPLLLAYNNKLTQTFEELLKAQASPDTTDKNGNTLLHIMLAEGNVKSAKSILSTVPTLLNVQNNDGKTPLIYALEKNKEQSISFLIEYNPDVKILDNTKSSALHYLAKSNFPKYIKPIITKGADPNLFNKDGDTPLFIAIKNNKLPVFQELLANGADSRIQNSEGDNCIIHVVKSTNIIFLKPLLDAGMDINTKTKEGKSLLLLAHENLLKGTTQAKIKIFLELIQNGADLNIPTSQNKSILLEYVEKGNPEIVQLLIEKGAKKDIINADGNNFLHISCILGKEEVSKVLLESGLQVNTKGAGGNTPLHFAVQGGFTQLASTLIKKGSFVDDKNNLGDTPLSIAVTRQDLKTIKELISARANLNSTNIYGNSLLMEAAKTEGGKMKNAFEIISLLLKGGANINTQNSFGNTPLTYATNRKNRKLIEFFLKEGADPNLKDFSGNNPFHKLIFTAVYDRIKNQELDDLIQLFYNSNADLNAANNDGYTPLIIAVKQEVDKDTSAGLQVARKLLDLSANPFLKDTAGKSALDYIKKSSDKEIKALELLYSNSEIIDKDFNPTLSNSSSAEKSITSKIDSKNNVYHLLESGEVSILSKYSDSGAPISSIKLNQVYDFSIDREGNIFILGTTLNKIEGITDTRCKAEESKTITFQKMNSNGEEQWIKYFSEKGACLKTKPLGVLLDKEDNPYIGMSFSSNLNYMAKLSPTGDLVWKEKIAESFSAFQIVEDKIFYFGSKSNTIQLDGKKGTSLFLGKQQGATKILYDLNSNSYYVAGNTKLSSKMEILYVSRFDKSGKLVWTKYFSSSKEELPLGISNDIEGNILVYGTTTGDLHGNKNSGGKDSFIFKIDPNGNRIWTEVIGSNSDDVITGIVIDDKNRILVHGITEGSLLNISPQGLTDVFLLRLKK